MTAAISAGSRLLSAACWRMMSSWRRGRVISRTASPSGPTPVTTAATAALSTAATANATKRRRRMRVRAVRREMCAVAEFT